MVHNGIEYGMMQAFAEGFALMKNKPGFDLDIGEIAELWRHGSVVRSWLLDLSADFLAKDQSLESIEPFVADSGEGRWTALESVEQGIPTPVMSLALMMRFASQGKNDYAAKMLAIMRQGFGGHAVMEGLDESGQECEFRQSAVFVRHLRRDRQPRVEQAVACAVSPRGGGPIGRIADHHRVLAARLDDRQLARAHARSPQGQDQGIARHAGVRALHRPFFLSQGRP